MDFPVENNLEIIRKLKSSMGENNLETGRMPPNKKKKGRMDPVSKYLRLWMPTDRH